MAKLSVVVPVYNVEAYLQEALESVCRQTLHDLEVIIVNDGSTDGSALIAESFAARNVRRFSTGWMSQTVVHADAYRATVLRTSAARHPELLRDCTIWNKVYRRSFWDKARLEYSAARYEDIPVAIRSYVLARSIDIRQEIVYYWRARETGELSRNQRSRELANVEGRMAAVLEAGTFLAGHAPSLK